VFARNVPHLWPLFPIYGVVFVLCGVYTKKWSVSHSGPFIYVMGDSITQKNLVSVFIVTNLHISRLGNLHAYCFLWILVAL
jgi:hypothetical protein